MKNLLFALFYMLAILFSVLIFFSCNNEELYIEPAEQVVEEVIDDEEVVEEEEEEEEDNTDDTTDVVVPVAVDDAVETDENISIDISILTNDTDIPTDGIITVSNLINGTVDIIDNGTPNDPSDDAVTYTPNNGFFGVDTFEYTVCDNLDPQNCDAAIVTITVNEIEEEEEETHDLKAFYSAYGGGSSVTGGRGGSVYTVTNLNNSGAGSFRDAVSQSNRTIVFSVSGTINLTGSLDIYSSNVTVAGQTAPEGGITLTGGRITQSGCDNFIIRYIKVRPTYSSNDAWSFINCNNIIIDHCSTSWGGDEVLSFRGSANNITIQRTLIGEGKTGSIFGDSDNASLGSNLSFLNNAYYNITHRHPNLNINSRADVINNIVFNWKYRLSRVSGNIQLNHIGNTYSLGCLNNIDGVGMMLSTYGGGSPSVYTDNNRITNGILTSDATDNWFMWQDWNGGSNPHNAVSNTYQANSAFTQIGHAMPVLSANDAFADVTTDCGANAYLDANGNKVSDVDSIDRIYLDDIINGSCVNYQSSSSGQNYNTTAHYNSFQNSVSSTPINSRSASFDTDNDGMPDAWETNNGYNPNINDASEDRDNDGYTNLEEYLNLIDD